MTRRYPIKQPIPRLLPGFSKRFFRVAYWHSLYALFARCKKEDLGHLAELINNSCPRGSAVRCGIDGYSNGFGYARLAPRCARICQSAWNVLQSPQLRERPFASRLVVAVQYPELAGAITRAAQWPNLTTPLANLIAKNLTLAPWR